jgi:transposase
MSHSCEVTITASVGIDVSKDRLDVMLRRAEREQQRGYANSAAGFRDLHSWLQGQGVAPQQTQVALEATGSYSDAISLFLYEQGYVVSVLNPAVLVDYRKSINIRSKTDALDARLLARYAYEQRPRAWKPLPPEMQTLRYLVARREDVQQMLQQERNRLHAGRMDAWIRSRVQQHVKQLDKDLQLIWKRILAHLKAYPSLKRQWRRLQTIRGIGPISAAAILAEVGEIERFEDPRALVSLAGLAVKRHDSGRSVHGKPKIDRHGRMGLRRILYMCARAALRWDAHMQRFAARLEARGKPLKVVQVAVMRKLLHIVYGVWKHDADYDPTLAFPEVA